MLSEKQIKEIREHLENAKNPVFFFDNDPDGLCSFLLLQRFIGKGKGVAIKSFPGMNKGYFRRVEEFKSDYIFILDKPIVEEEFFELAEKSNIPVVYIDHHNVEKPKSSNCSYYNTFYESGLNEPVAYLCYNITNRKSDIWIAAIGCITDGFMPDFIEDIKKTDPELINHKCKTAYDVLYQTELGKAAMIVSFALKDSTSKVVAMMKFLMKANSARDLLDENPKTKEIIQRFNELNEKYQRILKKADEFAKGDILFFTYSGDLSISQYTANQLSYMHPQKAIIVVYSKGNVSNASLRWSGDIRTATINAIKDIEGASGGGHEHSTGARIPTDKLDIFKKRISEEIERIKKA